jgi:hypothetical protein
MLHGGNSPSSKCSSPTVVAQQHCMPQKWTQVGGLWEQSPSTRLRVAPESLAVEGMIGHIWLFRPPKRGLLLGLTTHYSVADWLFIAGNGIGDIGCDIELLISYYRTSRRDANAQHDPARSSPPRGEGCGSAPCEGAHCG